MSWRRPAPSRPADLRDARSQSGRRHICKIGITVSLMTQARAAPRAPTQPQHRPKRTPSATRAPTGPGTSPSGWPRTSYAVCWRRLAGGSAARPGARRAVAARGVFSTGWQLRRARSSSNREVGRRVWCRGRRRSTSTETIVTDRTRRRTRHVSREHRARDVSITREQQQQQQQHDVYSENALVPLKSTRTEKRAGR